MANVTFDPVGVEGYSSFARIGSGGFSTVYRALQERFHRTVAVKVLNTTLEVGLARASKDRLADSPSLGTALQEIQAELRLPVDRMVLGRSVTAPGGAPTDLEITRRRPPAEVESDVPVRASSSDPGPAIDAEAAPLDAGPTVLRSSLPVKRIEVVDLPPDIADEPAGRDSEEQVPGTAAEPVEATEEPEKADDTAPGGVSPTGRAADEPQSTRRRRRVERAVTGSVHVDRPRPQRRRKRRALAALLGAALVIVAASGVGVGLHERSGYYLQADGTGALRIYQGQQHGLFWFHPTLSVATSDQQNILPPSEQVGNAPFHHSSSRQALVAYLARLEGAYQQRQAQLAAEAAQEQAQQAAGDAQAAALASANHPVFSSVAPILAAISSAINGYDNLYRQKCGTAATCYDPSVAEGFRSLPSSLQSANTALAAISPAGNLGPWLTDLKGCVGAYAANWAANVSNNDAPSASADALIKTTGSTIDTTCRAASYDLDSDAVNDTGGPAGLDPGVDVWQTNWPGYSTG